jgi:two-component system chemotaxis response regulator CheY
MPKLLIVEDDPVMRKLLAKAVASLEVEAHYASDGLYALDALRCNPDFDLILTDISMPILDGRTLINLIRQDPKFDHIPVIIMSGVVGMSEIADLLDAGAAKFIPKPFKMDVVREDVQSLLVTRAV